jgi:membrane associated rhomboid family serine protease
MMRINCCPQISWKYFTAQITLINVIIFSLSLIIGGVQRGGDFLSPSYKFMYEYANKDICKIRYDYEVWRFATAALFHANFNHILYNIISQLILGCMIETMIGTQKFIIIYVASGIGGNIFASLINDSASVGASTCIFGLLGAYLAYIIVNWEILEYPGSPRNRMLCFVLMMIMFNFMFSVGNKSSKTDVVGHFGGLLSGIMTGCAIIPPKENRSNIWEKKIKNYGTLITIFYFIGSLLIFYTIREPLCL